MTGGAKSRWADDENDIAADAERRREKEAKKRAKAERQRRLVEEQEQQQERQLRKQEEVAAAEVREDADEEERDTDRPSKRRRLSQDAGAEDEKRLLKFRAPSWGPCRHVDNFDRLNHIEEGSYGWVSRAKEVATGEIVALKKLKMEYANDGFPVTALREIQTLKEARHRHVVKLKEIVMGDSLQDVFLVMDFLEHDLRTLQEDMAEPFLQSEIKTLMGQLASAVAFLHSHWIIHRDLKTSNILMNNRGEIKLADFGMARYYSDPPPPNLTQLVVTLWYRAPELLLGTPEYDFAIDIWSLGCIFGELLGKEPLLQGKNEVDELSKIFALTGIPTSQSWPTFRRLPNARSLKLPPNPPAQIPTSQRLRSRFPYLTSSGANLLSSLLTLNPEMRPTAAEISSHNWFKEDPRPKSTAMMPTFPSKAGQERRRRRDTPEAPRGGKAPDLGAVDFGGIFAGREDEAVGAGFSLRLG